jgi:hypothetical protein
MIPRYLLNDFELIRQRRREEEDRRIKSRSARYRAATIKETTHQCHCGKHYAIDLVNSSGQTVARRLCPVVWWLACANPGTFKSWEEQRRWIEAHEFPIPNHEKYIQEQIAKV